jgi:hypothetical protein
MISLLLVGNIERLAPTPRTQAWAGAGRWPGCFPWCASYEGVPLIVIQRQLGRSNLGITSIYLQGMDNAEIIDTVHARPAPVIPASAGLRSRP